MYASLNFVKLVYPPISNQFAEWLSEEEVVREYVKHSKLYMLAQRHEVLFSNYGINSAEKKFFFAEHFKLQFNIILLSGFGLWLCC